MANMRSGKADSLGIVTGFVLAIILILLISMTLRASYLKSCIWRSMDSSMGILQENLEKSAKTASKMMFCLETGGLDKQGGEIDGVKYTWVGNLPVMTVQMPTVPKEIIAAADKGVRSITYGSTDSEIREWLVEQVRYRAEKPYFNDNVEWYADSELKFPYENGDIVYLAPRRSSHK